MARRKYDHEAIIEMARQNIPDPEIASVIGCSRITVIKVRQAAGLLVSKSQRSIRIGNKIHPARELARELKKSGKTYAEIGTILNISRQRAQQYLAPSNSEIKILLKASNGKCSHCGNESSKLDAHHSNYNGSTSELLCVSCHLKTHQDTNIPIEQKINKYDYLRLSKLQSVFGIEDSSEVLHWILVAFVKSTLYHEEAI